MSAHTSATLVKSIPPAAGGDGLKTVMGTFTGSASYDSGGSVLDVSGLFGSKVYDIQVSPGNADMLCNFVPGTSYATTDCKIRMDDVSGGAEASGDLSSTPGTFYFVALGTDA